MRKRLFAALRWIEAANKTAASKVAERPPELDPDSDPECRPESEAWNYWQHSAPEDAVTYAQAYTQAEFAAIMGAEEWFMAYETNSAGILWGEDDETATYSLTLSPEGFVRIRSYDLNLNTKNGSYSTVETDSKTGTWKIAQRILTLHLPDETLEFVVARIEGGVAILVDSDDGSCSVLMTEGALNAERESPDASEPGAGSKSSNL